MNSQVFTEIPLPSRKHRGRPKKIKDNNEVDVRFRDSKEELRKIESYVGYPDWKKQPPELTNLGNLLLPDNDGRLTSKTARYLGYDFVPASHRSTWILIGLGVIVVWYLYNQVS